MSVSGCSDCDSLQHAQQSAVSQQIQTALLKKQLDNAKAQGAAVLELLSGAAQLSKAAGKGNNFDAVG